jgi:imidazoleglycerol phosphate dehydratase HisB
LRPGKGEATINGSRAKVTLHLDGSGKVNLLTGSGFLDHMLNSMARTGQLDMDVETSGISLHRANAIGHAMGHALDMALGDRSGIRRYGFGIVPMDESMAQVALDISGRAYFFVNGEFSGENIGDIDVEGIMALIESLTTESKLTLHMSFYGENDHHMVESIFKALGLALRSAVEKVGTCIPSTKGVI